MLAGRGKKLDYMLSVFQAELVACLHGVQSSLESWCGKTDIGNRRINGDHQSNGDPISRTCAHYTHFQLLEKPTALSDQHASAGHTYISSMETMHI